MIRVLHLLDHDADFETRRGAQGIAGAAGEGFQIATRTIGSGGDWRDVATAAAMLRRSGDRFDVMHAWGGRALAVATLAARGRILFSPTSSTRGRTVRWLRAILAYRSVDVVCPTATMRRRLVQHGIPLDRCHLIRPGVDFSRVRKRRDTALRSELGFTDGDVVYLAAGESTREAAHFDAVWATGILHVAEPRYKLLLWGRGEMTNSLARVPGRWRMPDLLRDAESKLGGRVEFEELLPACDAMLVTARGPISTLPVAMGMAAGVPAVAQVSYTVGELLEDRHTALMVQAGKPRMLARRMLDLEEDPTLRWSIADMARTEAYEFFAFTRFVNQFRQVYRQIAANGPVQVPEESPGAGLRFHGRA